MEMAQRNKSPVNRKVYARLCRAFFFGRRFFWQAIFLAQIWTEGETALLAQTDKAEQHVEVHEDYGGNHF